jgi:DNA-binding MarR family transcriptional regulator
LGNGSGKPIPIGMLIKTLDAMLEKKANNELRDDDLTVSQVSVIMSVRKNGGTMSLKQIEADIHLSQPTVVGLVKRLEKKNLLSSMADARDARVKLVTLTDKGWKCCEFAQSHMESTDSLLLEGFTDREANEFKKLLEKSISNLT